MGMEEVDIKWAKMSKGLYQSSANFTDQNHEKEANVAKKVILIEGVKKNEISIKSIAVEPAKSSHVQSLCKAQLYDEVPSKVTVQSPLNTIKQLKSLPIVPGSNNTFDVTIDKRIYETDSDEEKEAFADKINSSSMNNK